MLQAPRSGFTRKQTTKLPTRGSCRQEHVCNFDSIVINYTDEQSLDTVTDTVENRCFWSNRFSSSQVFQNNKKPKKMTLNKT